MATESAVFDILRNPLAYSGWTIQGLGMLRLELTSDKTSRLHIWDPAQALNTGPSAHDHPWDISESRIILGFMENQRYILTADAGVPMRASRVKCGVGSHLLGDPSPVMLAEERPREGYGPGERYAMRAEEFHDSFPSPGTVTVIRRKFRSDRDVATICWSGNGKWNQDGFTRQATREEILDFVSLAKENLR